jgi:hypothetical protein
MESTSKGNDNNIFLILIILIVAILWFTGSLNPRKERFWGDGGIAVGRPYMDGWDGQGGRAGWRLWNAGWRWGDEGWEMRG